MSLLLFTQRCSSIVRSSTRSYSSSILRYQSTHASEGLGTEEQKKSRSTRKVIKATNSPVKEQNVVRQFSSVAPRQTKHDSKHNVNVHEATQINTANRRTLDSDVVDIINNDGTEISMEELYELASRPCTPLTLSDMFKYASSNVSSKNYGPQRLRNAQFLYKELSIRVAQRAVDLITLPHGLNKTAEVQEIAHKYLRYARKIIDLTCPQNDEEEYEFTNALREIVQDRKTIPMAIAKGVASLKDNRKEELDVHRLQEMEKALYRFFNARTGMRLIAEHHILSCTKRKHDQSIVVSKAFSENDQSLGCIKDDCNPYLEARRVAAQVMKHCKDCYGVTPEIEVLDCSPDKYADSKFTYVPHHLKYILSELLKNSCRATIGRHMEGKFTTEDHVGSHNDKDGVAKNFSLPSVRVIITKGAEDVTIKIADKGGGVPRSVLDKMWTFSHSNTSDEIQSQENDTSFETDEFSGGNIRGFGLPLARIYARYFGGELTLKSMEGYGVDSYLYLPVLGKACENLPKRVLHSPGNLDSVHDGNHHVYNGDSFSSGLLSGDEPWAGGVRHYSSSATVSFDKLDQIAI